MHCAVLAVALLTTIAHAAEPKVRVFVTPQVRDGYVDVDSGVMASLKDIRVAFQKSREFTVVATSAEADIVLTLVRRRTPGDSGSVGVPIGTMTMFLPVKRRAIDTVLRVKTGYEMAITSEQEGHDSWRSAASAVVKDVAVWVTANRSLLVQQ